MPQKYEREIEDILRRMGGTLPSESRAERTRRWFRRLRRRFSSGPRLVVSPRSSDERSSFDRSPAGSTVTPNGLLLASLGLAFLSFVMMAFQPSAAGWLALLAVLLFFGSIAYSIVRSRRRSAPRWRGRYLDDRGYGRSAWTDLSRRWRGWFARRTHGGPRF